MDFKLNLSYIMAAFYMAAGLMHFLNPRFYLRIMPPYIPFHKTMVVFSGLAEIGLGLLLLFDEYRSWAAWGVIALLVSVFPANIHHLTSNETGMQTPKWLLILRLPLQGVLIVWAFWYT